MIEKKVYFDTTLLQYCDNLRGIHQVIFQLVRLIVSTNELSNICFIATKKVSNTFLLPLGVKKTAISEIYLPHLFAKDVRFHGLFCDFRYRRIKKNALFIIHPEYRTVVSLKIPQLVIFHDFIFLEDISGAPLPVLKTILKKVYTAYLLRKCSRAVRAQALVTVSEFTKSTLLRHFPFVLPSCVTVLHNGIRFTGSKPIKARTLPPEGPIVFLIVGGLDESRKNVPALISHLHEITGGFPFNLYLVGKCPETTMCAYGKTLTQLGFSHSIFFPGVVKNEDLSDYYEKATFYLSPSLAEGFGLPMIEAMAHGCVVCAFNNTSIPEIGGDAVVLAENNDFLSWGRSIRFLLENQQEYTRKVAAGLHQADRFREEKMFDRYKKHFTAVLAPLDA